MGGRVRLNLSNRVDSTYNRFMAQLNTSFDKAQALRNLLHAVALLAIDLREFDAIQVDGKSFEDRMTLVIGNLVKCSEALGTDFNK